MVMISYVPGLPHVCCSQVRASALPMSCPCPWQKKREGEEAGLLWHPVKD